MIHPLATLDYLSAKLSMNPIVMNIEAADPDLYPNRFDLRYYCQVMIPESYLSGTFKQLVRLEAAEQPPVPAGSGLLYQGAFFEIQNQLDPLLERTAPEFEQSRISVADRLVMPYYCILSIENDGVEIYSETTPVQYVVKAGISEVDYSEYKDQFFSEFVGKDRRFLTWASNPKTIHPDHPEFLYFLTNFSPAPQTLRLYYQVMYRDYTTEEALASKLDNIFPFTTYCVPVGPKALGLDRKEKEFLSYSVWLTNENDGRISEVRYYRMDQDYHRNLRHVVFANSLGGFDTLCLTGQAEESVSFSRTISERYNGWEFLPSYSERVIHSATGVRQLVVNTGWLSPEALRYLEDLQLSKELYFVTDRALLPLLPLDDKLTGRIDDEEMIGRQLVFQYSNAQHNYSELPAVSGLFQRATGWRPKATACLLDSYGKRSGMLQVTVLEKYYLDDDKKVVGVPLKANVPGTEGYIPPILSDLCSVTPYVNTLISKAGSYNKTGCVSPLTGGPATITIPAGTYGSEVSLADAQAKAEAAWNRLNTQAYADQFGTCVLEPEKYTWDVPANHWHYRAANPKAVAVQGLIVGDTNGSQQIGNAWMVQQGPARPYKFPMNSNDLDFPTTYAIWDRWRMLVYGPANTLRRIQIYVDGVLALNYTVRMNGDGYEQLFLTEHNGQSFSLASGNKLYIVNDPA
ncbi:hypothetical protein LX87_05175 [Larkinella arboricola]|uniref:DUF5977 domain-containing protein n=1 Tax=Larkinella arboricola TaxID=643671 RepID=A0A327WNQ8_LARAB|nr:DUF5977 domain-containing protein [Larkinella arboricola]RAJ92207.1 hypothetical protein LX87_05175 [Larkinella arboricola]